MDLKTLARDWAALRQISGIHASGDGRWAFFCAPGDEVHEVWAVPTDGTSAPVQLTWSSDHLDIRDVSQDGMLLVLAQSRNASGHDHLLTLDRRLGNKLRLLTPKQDSHALCGGCLTRDGGVIFAAGFDYDTGTPVEGACVWWQSLATGDRRLLARTSRPLDRGPRLSPDGARLLLNVGERAPEGRQIWVVNLDGSGLYEVLNFGLRNVTRGDWLDVDRIAFVTDRGGQDRVGLLALDSGQVDWLDPAPGLRPVGIVACGGGGFVLTLQGDGQEVVQHWDGAFRDLPNLSGRGHLVPRACLPKGGWIALAWDAGGPTHLMRLTTDGHCLALTRSDPARSLDAGPVVEFHWVMPGGQTCLGWLLGPDCGARGLIVLRLDDAQAAPAPPLNPWAGFWAQAGYAVLMLASGGPEELRAGMAACLAKGLANQGRIAVAGIGRGSWVALAAVCQPGNPFGAAVVICPDDRPDMTAADLTGRFTGPLLLVQGQDGALAQAAQSLDILTEILSHPNEGRTLLRRGALAESLERSAQVLEAALAGPDQASAVSRL